MPDSAEAKALIRRTITLVTVGTLTIIIGLVVLGAIANSARVASRSSEDTTKIAFAGQARSACITDRRSIQSDELGQMQVHTLRALDAAFVSNDDELVQEEVAAGLAAADRWEDATATLDPDVLNLPPEDGGCGPPITSPGQIENDEGAEDE